MLCAARRNRGKGRGNGRSGWIRRPHCGDLSTDPRAVCGRVASCERRGTIAKLWCLEAVNKKMGLLLLMTRDIMIIVVTNIFGDVITHPYLDKH